MQLSVLWYCLICRMFSEVNSSCEEIDIYVKLFMSACNAFGTTIQKLKKVIRVWADKLKKMLPFHQQMPEMAKMYGNVKKYGRVLRKAIFILLKTKLQSWRKLMFTCQHCLPDFFNNNVLCI